MCGAEGDIGWKKLLEKCDVEHPIVAGRLAGGICGRLALGPRHMSGLHSTGIE